MSDSRAKQLAAIRRAARRVERRMRIARALAVVPSTLAVALAVAAVVLATRKIAPERLSDGRARVLLAIAALAALSVIVRALLRPLPPRAGSIALDRHHGLHDRLTTALAFEHEPAATRTNLMEIAIDDACERARNLEPRRAAPIRVPSDLGGAALLGVGVLALALLEVRGANRTLPSAATIDAASISPDDIELFKEAAKDLQNQSQNPEVQAAVERFNQLIEDLANKRLDRTEAFRRMEAIERELLQGAEADRKALEDELENTGTELKKSGLSKKAGESLENKDLDKAKQAMKELAERLRDKKKPDKAELDRLREALKRATEQRKEALAAINEKRSELREELLKKKQQHDPDAGAPKADDERLLKKKERELERLDRDAEQKERASRQLDKLDRDLAKAAEDLMRDAGVSAQDLEQAAEDLNRMQEQQMTDKEKEELRQKLEELRQLLRQQGQSGKQRMARLMKFGKRAHGSQGQGEGEKGDGQPQNGEGEDGQDGQDGQDGKEGGQGMKPGGQGGKGQQWVLGPGGKKILIPGQGSGSQGQGEGAGQGQQSDSQGNGKGNGVGHERGGEIAGSRTDPKMGTEDVQAQGIDSHEGPTNSQVILSAAERGFKGGGYKKVFTQYHTVAEQQINKDQIPDGYRFYVHRYFQLIRPRE